MGCWDTTLTNEQPHARGGGYVYATPPTTMRHLRIATCYRY
jgi:hypothetical protein